MNKILKNKKGMTLVTVLIIMTVLVLLCALLAETVMQTLILTKRHKNIDFAYYAGESAIENWTSVLENEICNDPNIGNSYTGAINLTDETSRRDYADYIIRGINETKLITQYIDIAAKTSSVEGVPIDTSAAVNFEGPLELVKTDWTSAMGNNAMDIYIGIKAKSSFSSASAYTTGNKLVYARKSFRVLCPIRTELEGAVYSVGDLYIDGNQLGDVVNIKGDVFVFGSYAAEINSPNQAYFGGIYAIDGGNLKIHGNAYSRSFIRAGQYGAALPPDNSNIFIYKDAIAQCIQTFGDFDRIAALRNAYTFDDLEINGNDSIIGINGSYFGLSRGGLTQNHDDSSAIVNSAMIHKQLTPGSFNSRISINGDVILGGSTWKINTDTTDPNYGSGIGEIENASLAYNTVEGVPHYKAWDGWGTTPIKPIKEYHKDLRDKYSAAVIDGKLNQFQVFSILDPLDNSLNIETWLNNIKNDNYSSVPSDISGFSTYEIVGNKRIYVNDLGEVGYQTNDYKPDLFVKSNKTTPLGSYRLDNLFDGSNVKYGKNYWDILGTTSDTSIELFGVGSAATRSGLCGDIYTDLLGKVHKYAARNYPTSEQIVLNGQKTWNIPEVFEFNKTLENLQGKSSSPYVLHMAENYANTSITYDIKDLFAAGKSIPDIYAECGGSRASGTFEADTKYYVLSNADPDVGIKISGTFNGIIVTAGKVILEDGASIYGSIIAAGYGNYVNRTVDGTLKTVFIPEARAIDSSNAGSMDAGAYAAVSVSANAASTEDPPYVDFFLGLAGGPGEHLTEALMETVIDKATSTTTGSSLIPTTVTTIDEKLIYLNKAARINLLEKFSNEGIYLYDIF